MMVAILKLISAPRTRAEVINDNRVDGGRKETQDAAHVAVRGCTGGSSVILLNFS